MTPPSRTGAAVLAVRLDDLHPNPANPRTDLGNLDDLVESIQEHGVLQPLLAVRRPAGGLMLLAGHRRLAACRRAKLAAAPVILVGARLADDQLTLAIVENLHRAQLSPMDEARACGALLKHGRSRRDISIDLARSGNWVADRLALLELPVELQKRVDQGELPIGKAAQLGHGIRKNRSGSVIVGARSPYHFTKTHDLADAATARCNSAGHPTPGRVGPACGACWEAVIRDDENGALTTPPLFLGPSRPAARTSTRSQWNGQWAVTAA